MRKILLTVFSIIIFLSSFTGTAFASTTAKISEVPDVRIIMNGRLTEYTDVPLIIEGRTMLPLRELLVNLGVPNDDEHIIYNNEEKSVTIIKGDTLIYLVANHKTAYVNDEEFELDVAPIIYKKNSRTYIPLRFVAEALDMKVVWEGKSKAVLLCDIDKYEETKHILLKSDEAMMQMNLFKQNLTIGIKAENEMMSVKFGVDSESHVDMIQCRKHEVSTYEIFGTNIKGETYYSDNTSYTLNPVNLTWEKKTLLQQEYNELFSSTNKDGAMIANELLYTGLTQVNSDNSNEILLQGDIYLTELIQRAEEQQSSELFSAEEMDINTYNIEISLDSRTYLINRIIMRLGSEMEVDDGVFELDTYIKVEYSKLEEDYQIIVPDEVIKSAVEAAVTY